MKFAEVNLAAYEPIKPVTMNILLAADDTDARDLLRQIISATQSHELTEVYDSDEAWAMLRESGRHFDVAVFDLNGPRVDVLSLVAKIRTAPALKQLPIVLCMATPDRQSIQRAAQLGIRHYVIKPYTRETLEAKLVALAAGTAAQSAGDPTAEITKRLGVSGPAALQLIGAIVDKVREWLTAAQQAQTPAEFTRVTISASGLRSACTNLGLRTLAQELDLVDAKFSRDFSEHHGEMLPPSPLEIAAELRGVEREIERIRTQYRLPG